MKRDHSSEVSLLRRPPLLAPPAELLFRNQYRAHVATTGPTRAHFTLVRAATFEAAGVEFLDVNGGGTGGADDSNTSERGAPPATGIAMLLKMPEPTQCSFADALLIMSPTGHQHAYALESPCLTRLPIVVPSGA